MIEEAGMKCCVAISSLLPNALHRDSIEGSEIEHKTLARCHFALRRRIQASAPAGDYLEGGEPGGAGFLPVLGQTVFPSGALKQARYPSKNPV
mgnify:CR=1 FL=1